MSDDIRDIIETVVRERLEAAHVQRVIVAEDDDFEGDRILRVTVIFDASKGKLDPHRTSGLARHLRSRLEGGSGFLHPVFRFISEADAKKLKLEAA